MNHLSDHAHVYPYVTSPFLDLGSRVLDLGFSVHCPGYRVQGPGSTVLDHGSRILEPGPIKTGPWIELVIQLLICLV